MKSTSIWQFLAGFYFGAIITELSGFTFWNSYQWWAIVIPGCFLQAMSNQAPKKED